MMKNNIFFIVTTLRASATIVLKRRSGSTRYKVVPLLQYEIKLLIMKNIINLKKKLYLPFLVIITHYLGIVCYYCCCGGVYHLAVSFIHRITMGIEVKTFLKSCNRYDEMVSQHRPKHYKHLYHT